MCRPSPCQVTVPWVQPGLCCSDHEEPRSCREQPAGRPAGSCPPEGGSPLEGASLQEWMHPGETPLQVHTDDQYAFPACWEITSAPFLTLNCRGETKKDAVNYM